MNKYANNLYIQLIFVLCGMTVLYTALSMRLEMNSDGSNLLIMADAIKSGNIFLKDWIIVNKSFYTSDLPFFIIPMLIFGFSQYFMYIVPGFMYAGIVTMCIWIACLQKDGSIRKINAWIVFTVIGIPSVFASGMLIFAGAHAGSLLHSLICLLCIQHSFVYGFKRKYFVIFFISLTLSLIGNPFAEWYLTVPLILVFIVRKYMLKDTTVYKQELYFVLLSILSSFISRLVILNIEKFGGFKIPSSTPINFVAYDKLINNFNLVVNGSLELFNANFFGKSLNDINTFKILLHLLLFISVVSAIVWIIIRIKSFNEKDNLYLIAVTSCVVVTLECLFSTMPVDITSTKYLTPVYLFGSILLSKVISFKEHKKIIIAACSILMISYLTPLSLEPIRSLEDDLADYLVKNNLKVGYSTYWTAGNVTTKSNSLVKLHQIASNKEILMPYKWFIDKKWYDEEAHFIVTDNDKFDEISEENITKIIGPPDRVDKIPKYTIMIWNKDISKNISKE